MRIRPFQAVYPNFDYITSPDSFCSNAKVSYREYQNNGFFEKAPQDGFYLYQIDTGVSKHTGIIALNDLQDFYEGNIKKHEATLAEKEQTQMELFLQWHAILKPILLTYDPVAEIDAWIEEKTQSESPVYETAFDKSNEIHRFWAVTDGEEIQRVQELFKKHVKRTYIADGHHRTTTTALLNGRLKGKRDDLDFDCVFASYFASHQLQILDYNRVVTELTDISLTAFLIGLSRYFDMKALKKGRKPKRKHEIIMFLNKEWFSLKWKKDLLKKLPKSRVHLDADLLNTYVFDKLLHIKDVRTDTRIDYVPGADGLKAVSKKANKANDSVGFVLPPVTFEEMMRLADMDISLPPKSTYFQPRLRSGMVVKLTERG